MLHGPNRIGLYCSPGKHGLLDREAWWARGEPCEVVAAYGIDPVMFMLAAQSFGVDQSELDVAGGIMGAPIELTQAEYVKLPIPAHAEFVVEGILHKGDVLPEGPLGEFTGYYGRERSPQPVMEIKAVHHRKSPIFTHALMARYPSCEIGAYYAIMRSARILDDLERIGVPGVVGAYSHPAAASGWGMVVVSVQQKYAGHSAQVLALAAQCPAAAYFTKWVIVVDEDVDPTDLNDVLWALSTRCHPSEDIDILRNTWSTGLDPSQFPPEARPYGSKVLINACKPHRHLAQFPQSTLLRKSVHDRVVARWSELGFTGTPRKMTAFHDSSAQALLARLAGVGLERAPQRRRQFHRAPRRQRHHCGHRPRPQPFDPVLVTDDHQRQRRAPDLFDQQGQIEFLAHAARDFEIGIDMDEREAVLVVQDQIGVIHVQLFGVPILDQSVEHIEVMRKIDDPGGVAVGKADLDGPGERARRGYKLGFQHFDCPA